jgi:two-component sensor histidine kinase
MIFDYASRLRRRPAFGWIFACASFGLALVIRFAIAGYLPPGFPFLTFFPAVMLTAFLGGTRPGVLCAVLSTLAAWYWFIPPERSFGLDYHSAVALGFFIFIVTIDLIIIHLLNEAVETVTEQQQEALRLADERRTLFQELQHRIANNLGFVSSLLGLHRRRLAHNAEAATALDDARLRLETLSKVHRRLYDPDTSQRRLQDTLDRLCRDIVEASGRKGITCNIRAADLNLPVERIMTLSLVLIEAISNSLKHAFTSDRGGTINVALAPIDGGQNYELLVSDDGPGLPDGFDPASSDRLGYKIMSGFARTLKGDISYANEGGAVTRLVFPAA